MLDFIQASMLWHLFEIVGQFAWFILIALAFGVLVALLAALQWLWNLFR